MSVLRFVPRKMFASRIANRSFTATSVVGAHRHGNDPDVIAREKARNLEGTQDSSAPFKKGAPGWNEHLASDSEAAVKADQHSDHEGKPTAKLQAETVARTHEHHHSDKGMMRGVEHHAAKHEKTHTDSEEAVKADRGEH